MNKDEGPQPLSEHQLRELRKRQRSEERAWRRRRAIKDVVDAVRYNPPALTAILFAVILVISIIGGCVGSARHKAYLKEHGCQLVRKVATGRTTGVKIKSDEYLYIYECSDGERTEIR